MNNRNVLRHLKRAVKLIEQGWTQGSNARDKNGLPIIKSGSKKAVSWCCSGALSATDNGDYSLFQASRSFLESIFPNNLYKTLGYDFSSLEGFNDLSTTTQKDVLKLFKKGISKLSKFDTK